MNWCNKISVVEYSNRPIKYLEICTYYNNTLTNVIKTYAKHKNSRLYRIDPPVFTDFNNNNDYLYNEFKKEQNEAYDTFYKNLELNKYNDKIEIIRGVDVEELSKFDEKFLI